jgi:ABC-2 type transport system ATP-binding protein
VTPVVEMKGVTKLFGEKRALSGIDFRVEAGEVVALLGPNGAGKTTAIAIMLGLRKASSGEVHLFGRQPRHLGARSRVGVMLQESGVPDELRVREVIDLFRSYYPRPLPTGEILARAGLEDKRRSLVGSLSGGQRQRLYYALAICGDPEVLFLDEPTVGLDVEARRSFWEQVRGSVAAGRTVVLTTHYLEEADALADRVVVIDRGRVLAEGTAAAIKARVGRKRVRFATPHRVEPALFDGLPVEGLSTQDGVTTLLTPRPEEILRRLFEAGTDVSELEVVGADLEEAFLEITRKGRDEEEGPL